MVIFGGARLPNVIPGFPRITTLDGNVTLWANTPAEPDPSLATISHLELDSSRISEALDPSERCLALGPARQPFDTNYYRFETHRALRNL